MKFFDEQSGATLHLDRYYGFGDAGGLAGSFDGYDSLLGAMVHIRKDYDGDTSSNPADLGTVAICILTGQEYVDQLKKVEPAYLETGVFGYFVYDSDNKMEKN